MHSDRSLFFCLNSFMVLLFHQKLKRVISILASFEPTSLLVCSAHLTTAMSCPMASERSTAFSGAGLLPPPSLPPSCAAPRVCPPLRARAREVAGGCARSCSLCSLTPVAAPTHCTPAPLRHTESALSLPLSLPVVCQCLSPSSSGLSPSLSCLVSFHRSQPRSRRVEGSALTAQTAATPGRPLTNLPAPLLLPHGPASLRCCCRRRCRHHRRVEGDPDPTLFLRPDKKRTKSPTRRR